MARERDERRPCATRLPAGTALAALLAVVVGGAVACGAPESEPGSPSAATPRETAVDERAATATAGAPDFRFEFDDQSGRLSLEASNVPLQALLDALTEAADVGFVVSLPEQLRDPVSFELSDVALTSALDALLAEFGKVVIYEGEWPDGTARVARVLVGPRRPKELPVPEIPGLFDASLEAATESHGGEIPAPMIDSVSQALAAAVADRDRERAAELLDQVMASERQTSKQRPGEGVQAFADRIEARRAQSLEDYARILESAKQLEGDPEADRVIDALDWVKRRQRQRRRELRRLRREAEP